MYLVSFYKFLNKYKKIFLEKNIRNTVKTEQRYMTPSPFKGIMTICMVLQIKWDHVLTYFLPFAKQKKFFLQLSSNGAKTNMLIRTDTFLP